MSEAVKIKLSKKDLETDQDVRWCPGCGDYAILATVQRTLANLGVQRENTVFISGIGCSSRFPYYMNTYGFHTIHGHALPIPSGPKLTRAQPHRWGGPAHGGRPLRADDRERAQADPPRARRVGGHRRR